MGPFIMKSSIRGGNALIPTLIPLLMVSPLPLMCFLLVCVRVSAGQRALLPHIPRVTGDGQLVNLSLKKELLDCIYSE